MHLDLHHAIPAYHTPRRPARHGYVAYLRHPDQHSNAANSHAGWGRTPKEAAEACYYWANQVPWVRVVRADAAPQWARLEAEAVE
jgi:hypothetical protein